MLPLSLLVDEKLNVRFFEFAAQNRFERLCGFFGPELEPQVRGGVFERNVASGRFRFDLDQKIGLLIFKESADAAGRQSRVTLLQESEQVRFGELRSGRVGLGCDPVEILALPQAGADRFGRLRASARLFGMRITPNWYCSGSRN